MSSNVLQQFVNKVIPLGSPFLLQSVQLWELRGLALRSMTSGRNG